MRRARVSPQPSGPGSSEASHRTIRDLEQEVANRTLEALGTRPALPSSQHPVPPIAVTSTRGLSVSHNLVFRHVNLQRAGGAEESRTSTRLALPSPHRLAPPSASAAAGGNSPSRNQIFRHVNSQRAEGAEEGRPTMRPLAHTSGEVAEEEEEMVPIVTWSAEAADDTSLSASCNSSGSGPTADHRLLRRDFASDRPRGGVFRRLSDMGGLRSSRRSGSAPQPHKRQDAAQARERMLQSYRRGGPRRLPDCVANLASAMRRRSPSPTPSAVRLLSVSPASSAASDEALAAVRGQ